MSNHSHEQVYCLLQPFVEGACFNLNVKGAMMSSLPEQTTLENVVGDATPIQPLPQALAGEIRREPVQAEGERELAAVVQVMLHHMPDDPGA